MGLEPTTLGTTNQYSNQLSYNHRVFSTLQKYNLKQSIQIILKFGLHFLFNHLNFSWFNFLKHLNLF
jgi:hypothetical protein